VNKSTVITTVDITTISEGHDSAVNNVTGCRLNDWVLTPEERREERIFLFAAVLRSAHIYIQPLVKWELPIGFSSSSSVEHSPS